MRKFLLGVIVGVFVAFVGVFIISMVIALLDPGKHPTIAPNSVLEL